MGTVILGTAAGLALLFGVLALFCSAVCEIVANILQMRARYLLRGLRTMLDESVTGKSTPILPNTLGSHGDIAMPNPPNGSLVTMHSAALDPKKVAHAAKMVNDLAVVVNADTATTATSSEVVDSEQVDSEQVDSEQVDKAQQAVHGLEGGLTLALFGHPLIQSLQSRRVSIFSRCKRNPAYLSADLFVRVLVDTLVPDSTEVTTLTKVEKTLHGLPDEMPAKKSLITFVKRAGGDINRFERSVESWYDEHMARVSGWYKRWSKVVLGVLGLLVAVLANIDTVQVARGLYVDQPLRAAVLAQVSSGQLCADRAEPAERAACANQEIVDLNAASLPLGWTGSDVDGWEWPVKVLGWLLTGLAVSFGGPFWFDALSRLAPIRNTGPKPQPT
jgi:hypothetical protein